MFDNMMRAALLNSPPAIVLAMLDVTPVHGNTSRDAQPAQMRYVEQDTPLPPQTASKFPWRFPRFGLGLGTSA